MKRVTGIGGIFFKSENPAALAEWYRLHLDFDLQSWGGVQFFWAQTPGETPGYTVWSPFKSDTGYFDPSGKPWMLNLRVADLDALLPLLKAEGVNVLDRREDGEHGKFAYVMDPEGNLLELWQPTAEDPSLK